MSARHRAVVRVRRYGGCAWWVEIARMAAALFCVGVWAAVLGVVYVTVLR
mgnify:CR=1 FL=1